MNGRGGGCGIGGMTIGNGKGNGKMGKPPKGKLCGNRQVRIKNVVSKLGDTQKTKMSYCAHMRTHPGRKGGKPG